MTQPGPETLLVRTSLDPDGLDCYSDHAEDIRMHGECSMCTSTDPEVVGHVLPDVERVTGLDPVAASERVMADRTAQIFDGVLLDTFTAQHILAVHQALQEPGRAKLRGMSLPRAAEICFKLTSNRGG